MVESGREPADVGRDFDQALAAKLGVGLFAGNSDADYVIAGILSHEWWDDSAWTPAD